jgi:hypothetical protein
LKIEFQKIKENNTGVPMQDKITKEWIIEGRMVVNSENITLKECSESDRKEICILCNDFTGQKIFVLHSYDCVREVIDCRETILKG